ncbi:MAG: hypothetical protein ABI605_20770 [Rhizobacter sp.]
MRLPLHTHLLLAGLLSLVTCAAMAAEEETAAPPPAEAASAPEAAPTESKLAAIPERIQTTLDSWQEFLDGLLIDALGPNPQRRYRVFGERKTVDLGKRWVLALDERATSRLTSAGVGIPAAGQPARTWEILHNGNLNQFRAYNQRDGSGRENGAGIVTTLAPHWELHTEGLRLHDDTVGVVRTDAQTGLRVGSPDLWIEGFVRRAALQDNDLRENWVNPKPHANFGGVQAQWEVSPGWNVTAQHQRAIKPDMLPGDERLTAPRTEFGTDYRPGGAWSGSRVYWREAPQLGLLSSSGVEERSTYRRVVGVEVPEGSPDGLVYTEIRHQSLLDDRDALLVVGWRHTAEFWSHWKAQTLIESGIPVGGENAVKSNTFDVRLSDNAYPNHALLTEVQAVRTPVKNSAFASVDYTQRLTQNSLGVFRASVTGVQPHDKPTDVPVNSGDATVGWGWQEPEERLFSTFWRYSLIGRDALYDNVVEPGVADRRARIVYGEFTWQARQQLTLLLQGAHRWDHDDSFDAGELRTTSLTVLRATQQIASRWQFSLHGGRYTDSAVPAQSLFGTALSVKLNHRIVLSLGYNFRGVDDGEMSGDARLSKGVTARLYIPTEAILTHWLKPVAEAKAP